MKNNHFLTQYYLKHTKSGNHLKENHKETEESLL